MNLHILALNMHNVLTSSIPGDVPDDQYDAARTARAAKAFGIATGVTAAERAEALASAEAFLRQGASNETISNVHLADVIRLLEGKRIPHFVTPALGANEKVVRDGAPAQPPEKLKLSFRLAAGHGVAPTSFLRTGAFTSQLEGVQVFDVLGMPGVKVERGAKPLNESHLAVVMFLLSKVTGYDVRLGTEVAFKPWDAVRVLGWSQSTQSLARLVTVCEDLRAATVRIAHNDEFDSKTAASLISSHTTSLDTRRECWTVILPAALLNALQDFRTFIKFETLSALPRGAARMLFCFLSSEKKDETTWDEDALAAMIGLTSSQQVERRRTMKEALEVLQAGVHTVKQRGKAIKTPDRCEVVETKNGINLRSIGEAVTKTFEPVVASFEFKKGRDGTRRVTIIKA